MSALAVVDTPIRRGFFGATIAVAATFLYRELSPYQRSSTNILNLTVQHQVWLTFFYAFLLLNHDGEVHTGVLAGMNEEAIAFAMTIANLR
jgi:predicted membrane-bound spermidine synthase